MKDFRGNKPEKDTKNRRPHYRTRAPKQLSKISGENKGDNDRIDQSMNLLGSNNHNLSSFIENSKTKKGGLRTKADPTIDYNKELIEYEKLADSAKIQLIDNFNELFPFIDILNQSFLAKHIVNYLLIISTSDRQKLDQYVKDFLIPIIGLNDPTGRITEKIIEISIDCFDEIFNPNDSINCSQ